MSLIPWGIWAASGGTVPAPAFLTSAPLWLDASDSATITQSSGSVSQWDNKGTLENFVQATGASQPTTNATTLNGLNVIDFSLDFINAQTLANWKFLHDGTVWFVASVVKYGNVSSPTSNHALFGTNVGGSNEIGASLRYRDTDDAFLTFITKGTAGQKVATVADAGFITPNEFGITSLLTDLDNATAADRHNYFINSTEGTVNNTSTSATSSSNPTYVLQIGAAGNATYVFSGSIAEIIVVSGSDATETNRQATVDYLNTKWSVF